MCVRYIGQADNSQEPEIVGTGVTAERNMWSVNWMMEKELGRYGHGELDLRAGISLPWR